MTIFIINMSSSSSDESESNTRLTTTREKGKHTTSSKPKFTLIDEYFAYQEEYSKKFGPKTIVMMQVGDFYEAYEVPPKGINLSEVSDDIQVTKTKKSNKRELSMGNPYMLGFNLAGSAKFFGLLVENGYTVVVIDQVTRVSKLNKKDKPRREVTNIYTAGTYLDNPNTVASNHITCLYFEQIHHKDLMGAAGILGIASIDIVTGACLYHEAYSAPRDPLEFIDEALRFINSIGPKEIIIFDKTLKKDKEWLINYLDLNNKVYYYYNDININYRKLSFQNEMFKLVYPHEQSSILSMHEQLNIFRSIHCNLCMMALLDYIFDHNKKLALKLSKPVLFSNSRYLVLGNNAISQLDVIKSSSSDGVKTKYKCLLDIINLATTAIGKRFVKNRIVFPLVDKMKLVDIYDTAEKYKKDNIWNQIESDLSVISDIEKLGRKMIMAILSPNEFIEFVNSISGFVCLSKTLNDNKLYNINIEIVNAAEKLLEYVENVFVLDKMKIPLMSSITSSFFKPGIYPDIDKMLDLSNNGSQFIDQLKDVLLNLIKDKIKEKDRDKFLSVKHNSKEGFYLSTTIKRMDILKEAVVKHKNKIVIDNTEIDLARLVFDDSGKTVCKIKCPFIKQKSAEILENNSILSESVRINYIEELGKIHTEYKDILTDICNIIAHVDYYNTIAKTACKYNYVKPQVLDKEYGCMKATNLRNAIVERIIDHEYIPHDICIGRKLKGMLLFGLNSSGKSVAMRSVGLAIIMAQAGFYVPATYFKYSPYYSLYTRISGNDNVFRGLSSFDLEMTELSIIHRRSDQKTLVIGDEISRGTEHTSGASIVAASIIILSKSDVSFIFTTHLHEIIGLEKIKELNNVKFFHILIEHDATRDKIIYHRKLQPGPGESIYGLKVAKYIMKDMEFIQLATKVKDELTQCYGTLIGDKTSRYNRNLHMFKCHICGRIGDRYMVPLETHHIHYQQHCNDGFVKAKPHLPTNSLGNLVVLCWMCHDKEHNGKIKIRGYIQTSNGYELVVDEIDDVTRKTVTKHYND